MGGGSGVVAPARNLRRDWGSREGEGEGEGDAVRGQRQRGRRRWWLLFCAGSGRASRARSPSLSLLVACWARGRAYGLAGTGSGSKGREGRVAALNGDGLVRHSLRPGVSHLISSPSFARATLRSVHLSFLFPASQGRTSWFGIDRKRKAQQIPPFVLCTICVLVLLHSYNYIPMQDIL